MKLPHRHCERKRSNPAPAFETGAALAQGAPSSIAGLDCFADARNDEDQYRARFMRRGRRASAMNN
jgi:hypothetical protein